MVLTEEKNGKIVFIRTIKHKTILTEEQKERLKYLHSHNLEIKNNRITGKPELVEVS